MGLMSGNAGTQKSNIFTNLVTVMEVEDTSKSSRADIAIKVSVKQEDYEYPNTMYISGWHVFDQLGQLDVNSPGGGWGSSFKVKEFFTNCGLVGEVLTDDSGQLLPHIFERATGNKIWTIRYPVKGKDIKPGTRYTWDRSSSVLQGKELLLRQWEKDNKNGYPRNYDTEYSYKNSNNDNDDTDFPFGQNKTDAGLPPDIPSDL